MNSELDGRLNWLKSDGSAQPFQPELRPRLWRYSGAVGLAVLALLARFALGNLLPPTGFPFLTFFPAVALAALYGGLGPGLLATALCTAAAKFFFMPVVHTLTSPSLEGSIALAVFLGVELLEVAVIDAMHRAINRERAARAKSARLAEALSENEATFNAMLDALPVGVIIADRDGRIMRDNAANRELWGVPPETTSWEGYSEWVGWWPSTGERVRADEWAMARALLRGELTRGELIECQRFDTGERRFYLNNAAPVRDASGRIVGGVVAELDVTEARRAEQALVESEARLRSALECTTDSVLILSADWRFTFLSRHAAAQIADGRDLLGQVIWDAFPDAVGSGFWSAYQRCMAERVPTDVEEHYGPLGRIFAARAFPADDGGIAVFFRDVTERRQTERKLEDFIATLDLASSFIRDVDGTIRYWSAGCERLYGWMAEEAVGRNAHELLHTVFPVPLAEIEATLERDGAWSGDLKHRARDGRILIVVARKALRRDAEGRPAAVVESLTDVTDARHAEAALAESAARLRLAVDVADLGIWRWERGGKGHDIELDLRCRTLLGLSANAPVDCASLTAAIPAEDRPAAKAGVARALDPTDPNDECSIEHRVRRPDGSLRWVAASGRAFFEEDPGAPFGRRPLRILGVARDVTDQREAGAVLARDRAELERLVSERTRDLEETQERLVHAQRMEALGRLAGGIAHDFNNVLQAVEGGARLIERHPADLEGARRRARMIAEAAGRGAGITRRLLSFARRSDLRAEPVQPSGLLEGIREILAHTLGAAIEVRVEVLDDLPPLLADRGQLETVLINLGTNARDAMPGGGTLRLSADLATVDGRTPSAAARRPPLSAGHYVRLAVTDDGGGMTPEVLARAAEPFFTTKGQGKGTGLGLAMAKGFAEQSGGAMDIESAIGRGTTIALWFPVVSQAAVSAPQSTPVEERAATTRHILLVDDDALVREVTAEQLTNEGYVVRAAASGPEALLLLDSGETVDLIVSDLSMPGMDGISTIREAQERRVGLPAILLTGFAGNAAELAIGGVLQRTTLLRKPVSAQVLTERAEMLLKGEER